MSLSNPTEVTLIKDFTKRQVVSLSGPQPQGFRMETHQPCGSSWNSFTIFPFIKLLTHLLLNLCSFMSINGYMRKY